MWRQFLKFLLELAIWLTFLLFHCKYTCCSVQIMHRIKVGFLKLLMLLPETWTKPKNIRLLLPITNYFGTDICALKLLKAVLPQICAWGSVCLCPGWQTRRAEYVMKQESLLVHVNTTGLILVPSLKPAELQYFLVLFTVFLQGLAKYFHAFYVALLYFECY